MLVYTAQQHLSQAAAELVRTLDQHRELHRAGKVTDIDVRTLVEAHEKYAEEYVKERG